MKRVLILAPIVLGLLCMMAIGLQAAKANVIYDLNNDGVVDIQDVAHVAAAFGSRLGDALWDPVLDFDANGIVNIRDVGLVAMHFGQMSGLTFVIPELPIGPILGLVGCFAALAVFSLTKPNKHNLHF